MASLRRAGHSKAQWGWWGLLLAAATWALWLRAPTLRGSGFVSHDVAGSLYQGMLLASGGFPYVDSVEMKAPGTFYLAWWLADGGRDIAAFQMIANVVAWMSAVAVAVFAGVRWGLASAAIALAAYVLHDGWLDSMDANYVTWAQLPAILALAAAFLGTDAGRRHGPWLVACGVMACWAALIKRPAGIVLPACICIVWVRSTTARWRHLGWGALGVALGAAPLLMHYALAGHGVALLRALVLNEWGLRYATVGGGNTAPPYEAALAFGHFVGLAFALAILGPVRRNEAASDRDLRLLWVCAAAAGLAALVGFRFYKGYHLATLPALCWLAAAPRKWPALRGWLRGFAIVVLAVLAARQVGHNLRERRVRQHAFDRGARKIAAHLTPQLRPHDRIWVWGWHLWDLYPMTGALSASRVYKSMGLLSPPNDDTWRRGQSRLRFVDGPAAQQLLADFRSAPPRFVVLGSTVPRKEFKDLQAFLRHGYRRDYRVRVGNVQIWRRQDRQSKPGSPGPRAESVTDVQ